VKLAALGAAGLVLPKTVRAATKQIPVQFPVIDTHIHLFDTTRTWGVPWPAKDDLVLFKPALPPRYIELSAKHGVVGAIAIEASPLKSDNDWSGCGKTRYSSAFATAISGIAICPPIWTSLDLWMD